MENISNNNTIRLITSKGSVDGHTHEIEINCDELFEIIVQKLSARISSQIQQTIFDTGYDGQYTHELILDHDHSHKIYPPHYHQLQEGINHSNMFTWSSQEEGKSID